MSEIIQTIARVRRAMPRNSDVMALCAELERILFCESLTSEVMKEVHKKEKKSLTRAEIQKNYRQRKKAKK